jgi:carbonic anhydrase
MITAPEALQRLREGHQRFVSNNGSRHAPSDRARRAALANSQHPFAIILGCSDSRVPPEIVFDQGLGELFVVRVAGNIAEPTQIGSVEFAARQFDTRLVVVLGHSRCGAVQAALKHLEQSKEEQSPHLRSIVDCVRPIVAALLKTDVARDRAALVEEAVRANISASVTRLRRSEILADLAESAGLVVVGAEYSLDTGGVEFFDDHVSG